MSRGDDAPRRCASSPGSRAVAGRFGTAFTQLRFRVAADEAAADARRDVLAAFDRLEAELESSGGEYLVGDRFSVADLTAAVAALPDRRPARGPADPAGRAAGRVRGVPGVGRRPARVKWVAEMFRKHRKPAATAAAGASAA